ncbi:hypothetical protein PCANC_06105 [Puccinia coronata f. sp. avenae]|uniref:Zn(2)-C6 fungal-type domain-containing protein n=1 Tax=Puccinia coronata f. sp. avenae TaxID=200324 RepID=A0A2N5UKT7_9BASI|nr:hypothetical protein PCASD_10569 [Puccinia coronata f. sp. avenae]PLW53413.1 hypothetical protein PCANC_06105 [Puccinia coronata f. sp. avenae]
MATRKLGKGNDNETENENEKENEQEQEKGKEKEGTFQNEKRRRYRVPRSCDRCRTAKVKCVFQNERCDACVKAGAKCTFANPGSLTERPPTYKDVEQLQARIRSLERLLLAADPAINMNDLPDPDLLLSQQLSSAAIPAATATATAGTRSADLVTYKPAPAMIVLPADMHGLTIPFKTPLTNAHWCEADKSKAMADYKGVTMEPECYIGPNSLFSTPKEGVSRLFHLAAAGGGETGGAFEAGPVYPVDEYLCVCQAEFSASTQCFYPEPELEQQLITLYFQHFHPILPVIHPNNFRALHQSGLAHTNNSFRALCLIIFSIASRHSDDPRVQLDMTGSQQPCRQFSGLRYAYACYVTLFRLADHQTNLFDLQAYVLMTIASFSALQPMISWIFVEQGLQCAQESGAHREIHSRWNANPLQDYLRRQAFFQLYELDHKISAMLGRTPWMEAEDFDLKPPLAQPDDPLGMFVNPYTAVSRAVYEMYTSYDVVRVSLLQVGSLQSMLPLLNVMKTGAGQHQPGGQESLRALKTLVDQIDHHATKWFDQLPPLLKRSNVESGPEQLMFSVLLTTSYYELQQLIHQTLFSYEEGTERVSSERKRGKKPHMKRCIKYAVAGIQEMSKLRLRGLLTSTFFWLPGRILTAVVLLICSLRKQRNAISRLEDRMRRDYVALGILILDDLAPSAHMAYTYSKILKILVELLDQENPSVLESLASPGGGGGAFSSSSATESDGTPAGAPPPPPPPHPYPPPPPPLEQPSPSAAHLASAAADWDPVHLAAFSHHLAPTQLPHSPPHPYEYPAPPYS